MLHSRKFSAMLSCLWHKVTDFMTVDAGVSHSGAWNIATTSAMLQDKQVFLPLD